MNQILVPTDFSATSKNALLVACELAKVNNSKLMVLHTYEMPHSSSTVMIDLSDVMKETAEKSMSELIKDIKSDYPSISVENKCIYGQFLGIVSEKSNDYDFVVMGTNGSSGIEEVFLGSNTANLIKKINAPLLAIPSKFDKKSFKKAIISLDTKNHNTEGNVEYLVKIITQLGIENTEILNVQKEDDTNEFAIERFIKKVNAAFGDVKHKFTFLGNDNIEDAIIKHSKKNDLIVVLSKSYGFFEGLFHTSISKKLAMHSENPLLVIKEL